MIVKWQVLWQLVMRLLRVQNKKFENILKDEATFYDNIIYDVVWYGAVRCGEVRSGAVR